MSGAEAAAAFGLAASVISVIGFSLQLWDITTQIRNTGSTITTADCAREAERLTQQCEEVKRVQSMKSQLEGSVPATAHDNQAEARVDAIAEEVLEIVGEIAKRLSKCKIPEDAKGLKWYRDVIVNILWNGMRTDVEAQMKKLETLRNELHFQVVISIKEKVNLAEVQRTKEFEGLGENLKRLVVALLDGEGSFDSQLHQIRQRQDHMQEGIQRIKNILLDDRHETAPADRESVVKKLTDRLWFNAISHRHDDIKERHPKTFEWIFTGQQKTASSSTTFTEWMQRGQGLYWISGRAGTGKSSLMRFLNDDKRTKPVFQEWAGERPCIMAPFYFWNADGRSTDINLRRLEGLYQGLLYTILKDAPDLAEHLFPDHVGGRDWGSFPTLMDLKQAFMRLLQAETLPVAIGLVIDGLDEYDAPQGDQIELANILKEAGTKPHLKVLVSSRPEFAFEVAFEGCAKLRLHELTENDRRIYVTDALRPNPQFKALNDSDNVKDSLIAQIVEKSEGIFLWVHIVVSTVQEELFIAKNITALKKVVAETPDGNNGLFDLFDHMLRKRIQPRFRTLGFRMIWTLQECETFPSRTVPWVEGGFQYRVATGLLFSFLEDDASSVKIQPLSALEHRERLNKTAAGLRRYCAGLLEIRSTSEPPGGQDGEILEGLNDAGVYFLHKDVSIFLGQQRQQLFLKEILRPVENALHADLLKCLVMILKTYDSKHFPGGFGPWYLADVCMRVAQGAEEYAAGKTENILDQLDQAMTHHFPNLAENPWESPKTEPATRPIGQHWVEFFPYDRIHLGVEHYPWPNPAQGYELDFLCFAIQNGLFYYVRSKLERNRSAIKRRGLPLLSCACAPVPHWWLLSPNTIRSRTVEMLLQFGANPNEEFLGYSPWQMALLVALDSILLSSTDLEELARVLRLLLQRGADPSARVKWSKTVRIRKGKYKTVDTERSTEEQIRIAFIDRFTEDQAEFEGPHFVRRGYLHRERYIAKSEDERRKFAKLGNELVALVREKEKEKHRRNLVTRVIERTKAAGNSLANVKMPSR